MESFIFCAVFSIVCFKFMFKLMLLLSFLVVLREVGVI